MRKLKPFSELTEEEKKLIRDYNYALRPINDSDLPDDWRLRDGPPYLCLGVFVDCSAERASARAQHAAKELGEPVKENMSGLDISSRMNKYIAKLLRQELASAEDDDLTHVFKMPILVHLSGTQVDSSAHLRFFGFCSNQRDRKREHEVFTKPAVKKRLVEILEDAWGFEHGRLEAKWFFEIPHYSPEFFDWKSADYMLTEMGMPDSLKSRA